MKKRILIGIDNSVFSQNAINFGIDLAKKANAVLVGISVVDTKGIEKSSVGAAHGAYHMAEKVVEKRTKEAEVILSKLMTKFVTKCDENKIECETLIKKGNPFVEMVKESEIADLLLIGIHTFFHFETNIDPGNTFEKMVENSECPIIAITEETITHDLDLLLAYDGNLRANNVMRQFAAFNDHFKISNKITVLSVEDKKNVSEEILIKANSYLSCHFSDIKTVSKSGKARTVIYETSKEMDIKKNTLLIIGTNGNNEISDRIFGNSIKKIIDYGKIPLFIFN